MTLNFFRFVFLSAIILSCNTGKLTVVGDIANSLKEVSASEYITGSTLIWVIEDAGNKNHLYGLNTEGDIIKDIDISNAENIDWEDITSDNQGHIYIGDFGNNKGHRDVFSIYKINNPETLNDQTTAEIITFKMPKNAKNEDFEAFFIFNNNFYIFTKETAKFKMIQVPNHIGNQVAKVVAEFNLEGKHNKITSADISDDNKTIILLNHDKAWTITNFASDDFFNGTIEALEFYHDSQKEGICFKNNNTVFITDERNGSEGGNIYTFKVD